MNEMHTNIFSFSVELAKKIENGHIKGRIITRNGSPVRIVSYDAKGKHPIVALVSYNEDEELPENYTENGHYTYDDDDTSLDIIIEVYNNGTKHMTNDNCPYINDLNEKSELNNSYSDFNDGDFIVDSEGDIFIFNGIYSNDGEEIGAYVGMIDKKTIEFVFDHNRWTSSDGCRIATKKEKEWFLEKLKDYNKRWDEENKVILSL